ncbi:hypothetical protein PG996_004585 [Apiospora saccharicola]|uniref:Uncharacterized protein n=1 Tax=Apiospora saccharicola TaxID=335842 RepID=A0ABR1W4I1_9PEZI
MARYNFQNTLTICLLLAWSRPALAADGNLSTDLVIGLSVAAGVTVAVLVVLCFLAQCVPGLCCGLARKEESWFNGHNDNMKEFQSPSPMIEKPAPIVHPMYK